MRGFTRQSADAKGTRMKRAIDFIVTYVRNGVVCSLYVSIVSSLISRVLCVKGLLLE